MSLPTTIKKAKSLAILYLAIDVLMTNTRVPVGRQDAMLLTTMSLQKLVTADQTSPAQPSHQHFLLLIHSKYESAIGSQNAAAAHRGLVEDSVAAVVVAAAAAAAAADRIDPEEEREVVDRLLEAEARPLHREAEVHHRLQRVVGQVHPRHPAVHRKMAFHLLREVVAHRGGHPVVVDLESRVGIPAAVAHPGAAVPAGEE